MMFPTDTNNVEEELLSWDHEKKYTVPKLSVYYQRVVPGEKFPDPKYRQVDITRPLKEILTMESHEVPGYPCFHVLSRGSTFEEQWLGKAAHLT